MSVNLYKLEGVGPKAGTNYYFTTTAASGSRDVLSTIYLYLNKKPYGLGERWASHFLTQNSSSGDTIDASANQFASTAFVTSQPSATSIASAGTFYQVDFTGTAVFNAPALVSAYTRDFAAGTGGTITKSVNKYSVAGDSYATPTASSGYRFLEWRWTSDNTPVSATTGISINATTKRLTITSAYADDTDVYAYFVPTSITLNVTAGTGGSVELYVDDVKQAATTGFTFSTSDAPKKIRIVALPQWNYSFTKWTFSGVDTAFPDDYTFYTGYVNIAANAVFTILPDVDLNVSKTNPTYGTISLTLPDSTVVGELGNAISIGVYTTLQHTLTAAVTNASLYKFEGWYTPTDTLLSASLTYTFTPSVDTTIVAKFAQKTSYTFTTAVDPGDAVTAGCAISQNPSTPDFPETSTYLEGREIVVTALPAAGWRIGQWFVNSDIAEYDETIPATPGDPCPQSITVEARGNIVVTGTFGLVQYVISAVIDTPSLSAGVVEVQELTGETWGSLPTDWPVNAGATVRVKASPSVGYVFGGIYENGVALAVTPDPLGDGYYTINGVTSNRSFVVKFAASVTIKLSQSTTGLGAAYLRSAGGTIITTANTSTFTGANIILGDTVVFAAEEVGETAVFKGWFLAADVGFTTPTPLLGTETSVVVSEEMEYVARFDETPTLLYVGVYNSPFGYGQITYDFAGASAVTEADYEMWLAGEVPADLPLDTADRFFTVPGAITGYVSVLPAEGATFLRWEYRTVEPGTPPTYGEWTTLGTSTTVPVSVSGHIQLRALYSTTDPLRLFVGYTTGSNSSSGAFAFSPAGTNGSTSPTGTGYDYVQGTQVVLSAIPANGYVFVGWYSDQGGNTLLSAATFYTVTVDADTEIYAKFQQDTNALYRFDTGPNPKMATYRTKRFVATVPFDLSAARVYADGYPVVLNIYACSSPFSPVPNAPTKAVVVKSQDAVRLPSGRKEKYFEIEVVSPYPVTEITNSTSMGGLNQ